MYTCQISQKCVLTWQHRLVAKKIKDTEGHNMHFNSQGFKRVCVKALASFGGTETKETALFTEMFDKFFDALNVWNFTDGKTQ